MELSPADHNTETTFGWGQVAFGVPSNAGIPLPLLGVTLVQVRWHVLEPTGTQASKIYTQDYHVSLHSFSPKSSFSSCSYTPQLSTFPPAFPSQYYWRVTWKRNPLGWGFAMQCWGTLTEPSPKMFMPLVPTCVCNCTCWKEPTTPTVEIKAIQHETPRSLFWLPSQMWR